MGGPSSSFLTLRKYRTECRRHNKSLNWRVVIIFVSRREYQLLWNVGESLVKEKDSNLFFFSLSFTEQFNFPLFYSCCCHAMIVVVCRFPSSLVVVAVVPWIANCPPLLAYVLSGTSSCMQTNVNGFPRVEQTHFLVCENSSIRTAARYDLRGLRRICVPALPVRWTKEMRFSCKVMGYSWNLLQNGLTLSVVSK